jgi:hypothetical protein
MLTLAISGTWQYRRFFTEGGGWSSMRQAISAHNWIICRSEPQLARV